MDYTYKINKILPKAEFMSVTYSAEGYPDYRRNFNPVEFTQEYLVQLIENFAPHVVDFWERQVDHPEDFTLENGSASADAPAIESVDFSHAPTIEPQPEFDRFTQYITLNQIENPMQETVGWTIHEMTAEEQAEYLEKEKLSTKLRRNDLLSETDWMMFSDTPAPSQEWLDYRQALRDITSQANFPINIVWPTKPA